MAAIFKEMTNKRLGRKLEKFITVTELEITIFSKKDFTRKYFKFQPIDILASQSINVKYSLTREYVILFSIFDNIAITF